MEGAKMTKTEKEKDPEHARYRPRKILLDPDVYCPYSMRESDGDADCDHDFEEEPSVTQGSFAIWNCTICGRAVRFDLWH
jgi:hypothetical protein